MDPAIRRDQRESIERASGSELLLGRGRIVGFEKDAKVEMQDAIVRSLCNRPLVLGGCIVGAFV